MLYSGEIEGGNENGNLQTTTISNSELHALGFYVQSEGFSKPIAKPEYGADQDISGARIITKLAIDSGKRGCGNPNCCMNGKVIDNPEKADSLSVSIECSAEDCSVEGIRQATQYLREVTEVSLESHQATLSRYNPHEV